MTSKTALQHANEPTSNVARLEAGNVEPRSLRTYTPTQAVLAASAGVFHWTPEGRRLYDFTSGVLVTNLGHNRHSWLRRHGDYMGWSKVDWDQDIDRTKDDLAAAGFFRAQPLNAYNAVTSVEVEASRRLVDLLKSRPGGKRLEQVMWAASGSEAIQKALWAALARDRSRDMIIATRHGFHGKKGLAGAVTGCESDRERDPRVRFIGFPMCEYIDVSRRDDPFDPTLYRKDLEALKQQFGRKLAALITEPYLGGAGSFHPPKEYLHLLQAFCRENDLIFILDEVQANFGRTGDLFAYESYDLEPDFVVLGKGLGNGVPVAAAVGRADVFASLDYGEGSDTWSANPLCCAAVLATLDEFAATNVLATSRRASAVIEHGLLRLKELPFVAFVRGEKGGMVWGVEMRDHAGKTAEGWANDCVLTCYLGDGGDGIHLLGPLSKKVLRIAPPLVITEAQAAEAMDLMYRLLATLVGETHPASRQALSQRDSTILH
jgi:4-aminobutyrate aminotransferase-like enzyme